MKKHTVIRLQVGCSLLLALITAIAYAWHLGILNTFAYLYESFGTQESSLFRMVLPYAQSIWLIAVVDAALLGYLIKRKHPPYLWVLLGFLTVQLLILLAVMYSSQACISFV
jgi:hypothetical protein